MILPNREIVIENIRKKVEEGAFNDKVEVTDPVLSAQESAQVINRYLQAKKSFRFAPIRLICGWLSDLSAWYINRNTTYIGLEKLDGITDGALITANHFHPLENTAYRILSRKMKKNGLFIICQDTNLKMSGIFGFFFNFSNLIPVSNNMSYMTKQFDSLIEEAFKKKQNILIYPEQEMWFHYRKPHFLLRIYPEQEMWFHYRKPRPGKRGAYYYAAKHRRPIISCFTEIVVLPEMETDRFHRTKWVVHILDPIYPDPALSLREDSMRMLHIDDRQKKEAYERIYGRSLEYTYSDEDIAGFMA